MKVNSTTNTHIAKHIHINVLCFEYAASDNSMTGLVPHLNVYLTFPILASPSWRLLKRWTAVCIHSPSLLPTI